MELRRSPYLPCPSFHRPGQRGRQENHLNVKFQQFLRDAVGPEVENHS